MPDILKEVKIYLLADSTITDLVSTRIVTGHLYQGQGLPAISLRSVGGSPHDQLVGIVPIAEARIEVDCYADSREDASEVWNRVRLRLTGYRGTPDTIYIKGITQATGDQDLSDPEEAGTDQRRYIVSQDFRVFYETTTS